MNRSSVIKIMILHQKNCLQHKLVSFRSKLKQNSKNSQNYKVKIFFIRIIKVILKLNEHIFL